MNINKKNATFSDGIFNIKLKELSNCDAFV
jgi:hypothetical protein